MKPKCVLLDANIVIRAHEINVWENYGRIYNIFLDILDILLYIITNERGKICQFMIVLNQFESNLG